MKNVELYRAQLRSLAPDEWKAFLLSESGLSGPRGNLELASAVQSEGNEDLFLRLTAFDAEQAPVNSPQEFLAFCGVLGLYIMTTTAYQYLLTWWISFPFPHLTLRTTEYIGNGTIPCRLQGKNAKY